MDSALHRLVEVISNYENEDPNSLSVVLGDFNQADLQAALPNYKHVKCPLRGKYILNHCYCSVKDLYKSITRANLRNSDHSTTMLIPIYKQQKAIEESGSCKADSILLVQMATNSEDVWTILNGTYSSKGMTYMIMWTW